MHISMYFMNPFTTGHIYHPCDLPPSGAFCQLAFNLGAMLTNDLSLHFLGCHSPLDASVLLRVQN